MVELGTALRELAEGQQPLDGPDAGDLWQQGRRRVRRHRMLGAAAAACVLGVAVLGVGLVPDRPVAMPAGQSHAPAFPESIHVPDPDLAGTAEAGPIGPLALVAAAPRGNGQTPQLFAISATTGTYRFLDLPGQVPGTTVALSPDGNHVGYWYAGEVPDPVLHRGEKQSVAGVAIYDTVSGKVTRSAIPSDHGLDAAELFWIDDDQLILVYFPRATTNRSSEGGSFLWGTRMPKPVPSSLPDGSARFWRDPDGGFVQDSDTTSFNQVEVIPGAGLTVVTRPLPLQLPAKPTPTSVGLTQYAAVYRSGDLVLAVPSSTAAYAQPLMTGRVAADGSVGSLSFVDRLSNVRVLGWKDAHTVLVSGFRYRGGRTGLYEADLAAGTSRYLGTDAGTQYSSDDLPDGPAVATELTRHTTAGREPVVDHRSTAEYVAAAGAVVLLGSGALVLVRRRSRVQG
jgi:hypothetical protein